MIVNVPPPRAVRIGNWARNIRSDVVALWVAARDPRTPWHAKLLAGLVAAYALSPVDLIPDFIPVLGLLDDILIVPLGILLVIRLIPESLMNEFRRTAYKLAEKPTSWMGMLFIGMIWLIALLLCARWLGWV